MSVKNANLRYFISGALHEPMHAIAYYVSQSLQEQFPGEVLFHTQDCDFELAPFVQDGHCTAELQQAPQALNNAVWLGEDRPTRVQHMQTWHVVEWKGSSLHVLQMNFDNEFHAWIIAPIQEAANQFFREVCAWQTQVHGDIVVFENGRWSRSEHLYESIQSASLDSLILPPAFKKNLQDDLSHFFASRALYEKMGVPWKRGLLFIGPPGNGKTHTVKALINWLQKPCIYVKSFDASHLTNTQVTIRNVFERARRTTPCLLVMEDLDSLITKNNRAFFLNELDGFDNNRGVVILATTNYPEQLDPAITDRPSRFDRKYYFGLPAMQERIDYLADWNERFETEMKLSEEGMAAIASETEGFSFAYLKELALSSMMSWMNGGEKANMDLEMQNQCKILREQMSSEESEKSHSAEASDDGGMDGFPFELLEREKGLKYGPLFRKKPFEM